MIVIKHVEHNIKDNKELERPVSYLRETSVLEVPYSHPIGV